MEYIFAHATDIIAIATGIVTVASLIANLTPSESDNAFIDKIGKFIHALAMNFNVKK